MSQPSADEPKRKNNHFVPRLYLKRFSSVSEKQIGLFNLRTRRIVKNAPIKSQCARDYFYTKDPSFEKAFGHIEGDQRALLDNIISSSSVPPPGSAARSQLSFCITFQSARTVSSAEHQDHMANEFGKAILKHHLTAEGNKELLEFLPRVRIQVPNGVMEEIVKSSRMYPLIDDMDCTLFLNETSEDFLTSDHPVAQCSSLPETSSLSRRVGFASRGLIILYPISPRVLLFLSDPGVYLVARNASRMATLTSRRDVMELNLAQCRQAFENLYFAAPDRVRSTLDRFQQQQTNLRPAPERLREELVHANDGRRTILLEMAPKIPRFPLPRPVCLRQSVKTGKFSMGDAIVRDPLRVQAVMAEVERIQAIRDEASERAKSARESTL